MLTALVGYVWNSSVLVEAFCTILFLILIRMYSRDLSFGSDGESCADGMTSKSGNSPIEKVTKKIGDKLGDVDAEVKDVFEELTASRNAAKKDRPKPKKHVTSELDLQFYGELFLASILSSSVVKMWWK